MIMIQMYLDLLVFWPAWGIPIADIYGRVQR